MRLSIEWIAANSHRSVCLMTAKLLPHYNFYSPSTTLQPVRPTGRDVFC